MGDGYKWRWTIRSRAQLLNLHRSRVVSPAYALFPTPKVVCRPWDNTVEQTSTAGAHSSHLQGKDSYGQVALIALTPRKANSLRAIFSLLKAVGCGCGAWKMGLEQPRRSV